MEPHDVLPHAHRAVDRGLRLSQREGTLYRGYVPDTPPVER